MTLIVKTSRGAQYLYFQAGPKSLYIAPKDDPSKAKTENVKKAIEYTQERIKHYNESLDELLQFLPPKNASHTSDDVSGHSSRDLVFLPES